MWYSAWPAGGTWNINNHYCYHWCPTPGWHWAGKEEAESFAWSPPAQVVNVRESRSWIPAGNEGSCWRLVMPIILLRITHVIVSCLHSNSLLFSYWIVSDCDLIDCSTPGFPVLLYRNKLSPTVYSNSCPLSRRCYLTISSSVIPFSFCPQSFPASESFPVNQLFASGGQSIRASASVLLMNIQGWFPLGLTGLISLLY